MKFALLPLERGRCASDASAVIWTSELYSGTGGVPGWSGSQGPVDQIREMHAGRLSSSGSGQYFSVRRS
eukprot:5651501-Pleurochrysis_carterae.AAC.2